MTLGFRAVVLLCLVLGVAGYAPPLRADEINLAAYKGKVVYLDFWASWCTPCRLSFPWMNQIAETLGPKGLVVLGVNVDHDRAMADEFLQGNDADFHIIYDTNGAIAKKYDFRDMPTSVLIGRDGKVHSIHAGFFPEREPKYFADISDLLQQKAP